MVSKQFSFIDLIDLLDTSNLLDLKGNNALLYHSNKQPSSKSNNKIWSERQTDSNRQLTLDLGPAAGQS